MDSGRWRWGLGVFYVFLVAVIWIAASFVVQNVIDSGVSPFLISYIANSLFVVYIPIVEFGNLLRPYWQKSLIGFKEQIKESIREDTRKDVEQETRLSNVLVNPTADVDEDGALSSTGTMDRVITQGFVGIIQDERSHDALKSKGRVASREESVQVKRIWTRKETASISLIICPIWFLAQFTFNLSLKYTSVTSNTILSSTSSLFTFLTSVRLLGEKFTVVKLASVLICMAGTVFVAFGDSEKKTDVVAPHPVSGDIICLISAMFYAAYTTLIRKKFPDESSGKEEASTALFLGFVGLFNALIFFPFLLILHFTRVETLHKLSLTQLGLIIGKGLLDNVLSDYLWAKAVLLTTPTVATAGLTLQVPIAAIIDSLRGNIPGAFNIAGAVGILVGFFGISHQPASDSISSSSQNSEESSVLLKTESPDSVLEAHL